MVSRPIQDGHS
uniref:Uncharacterized protein n=1 Tax=Arundo donax TaxID=35708 RepID=A0A0A8Y260_ARUDO